jgi:hypothetical protein
MISKISRSFLAVSISAGFVFGPMSQQINVHASGLRYLGFSVSEPSPQRTGTPMKLEAWGEGEGDVSYKFYIYEPTTGQTKYIKTWNRVNTTYWCPEKPGTFDVYVDMMDEAGNIQEKAVSYTITKGDTPQKQVRMSSSSSGQKAFESVDFAVAPLGITHKECRFFAYNPQNSYQEEISKSSETIARWEPKKPGDYLVFADITTESGEIFETHVPYKVTEPDPIIYQGFWVDNPSPKPIGTNITINAAAKCTNQKPARYRFFAYNRSLDQQEEIKEYSEVSSGTWSPSIPGDWEIYVDIIDGEGHIFEKCLPYTIEKPIDASNAIPALGPGQQFGIDISKHQGAINFKLAKANGVQFAIIRLGHGSDISNQDDPFLYDYVRGAKEAGIPIGFYLFSYAQNDSEAQSELEHTLRLLTTIKERFGAISEYPIYLDIEDDARSSIKMSSLGKDQLTRQALIWCQGLRAAGYMSGIYACKTFCDNLLDLSQFSEY